MSKSKDATRLAYRKGYRVLEDGSVENAEGKIRKLQAYGRPGARYLRFNINTPSGVFPVCVHKLQAFQKFGEDAFVHDCTRHIDGNSMNNSPDNIELGSHRDNAMDRAPEARQAHAQRAADSNIAYDWAAIESDYFNEGLGFKKLAAKYGARTGTLSNHFNKIPGWSPKKQGPDWEAIKHHLAETNCDFKEVSRLFGVTVRSCNRTLGSARQYHLPRPSGV